ncbi:MAG: nucleoside hydrolase [Trueperaceae bacterium]
MTRPRIFLDCDPGHDDAFALLYAATTCELVGIGSVSGNVGVASTTRNALVVRDLAARTGDGVVVPVHRGAAGPLVGEPLHAPDIHGESGLDGPELPTTVGDLDPLPAAQAIVRAARTHDDLWLVATGPLTNVALAIHLDPELPRRLRGIVWMGGSRSFGNVTAAAEFNALADPEAADVVMRSGAHIVMVGLDLTHQFTLGPADTQRLRDAGTEAAAFCADLLAFFQSRYGGASGRQDAPMHDPCTLLVLTDPSLIITEPHHVQVELRGTLTRGMTLCDRRDLHRRGPPNVEVATRIDADAARERLHAALASYR